MSNLASSIRKQRWIVTKHLQAEVTAELDALLPSIPDKSFKGQL